jgi:hypothetical protein
LGRRGLHIGFWWESRKERDQWHICMLPEERRGIEKRIVNGKADLTLVFLIPPTAIHSLIFLSSDCIHVVSMLTASLNNKLKFKSSHSFYYKTR